jgi:hypothetical protein
MVLAGGTSDLISRLFEFTPGVAVRIQYFSYYTITTASPHFAFVDSYFTFFQLSICDPQCSKFWA